MNEKPRILIIDDDESSVHILRTVFQESGFEAMVAFDGLEGLDLATKHLPDVILTGIVMPRMSGFDMIRNLQSNVSTAKIPVLVYSHLGREGDRSEAEELKVRGFLIRGMTTPNEIVEQARHVVSPPQKFYIKLESKGTDAKALKENFPLPHETACRDGKEVVIQLESLPNSSDTFTFKATLICGKRTEVPDQGGT